MPPSTICTPQPSRLPLGFVLRQSLGVQIASEGVFSNTSLLSAVYYYNNLCHEQFSSRHFPSKTCQQNFVQVNSLIQPFLYFAINRRLQEDLIRKMQFCSSRETNNVTKVSKNRGCKYPRFQKSWVLLCYRTSLKDP